MHDACYVSVGTNVKRIWESEIKRLFQAQPPIERLSAILEELADGPDTARVRLPELFLLRDAKDFIDIIRKHGGWLRCRVELGLANDYEQEILNGAGEEMLRHIEAELSPTRSYKFAVLNGLFQIDEASGRFNTDWNVTEIAERFLRYYQKDRRRALDWPEFARWKGGGEFPQKTAISHIRSFPLKLLSNDKDKLFVLAGEYFRLKEEYWVYWKDVRYRELVKERLEFAEARYWYTWGAWRGWSRRRH